MFSGHPLSARDTRLNIDPEIREEYGMHHIICDVPYVSQETDFYCIFACPAMIFKYHKLNTSLHEVLYNSGAGHSMAYSLPFFKRLPVGCGMVSKWDADCSFLADLYGLSFEKWQADKTLSEEERWHEYWIRVKQNITQNIPIMTNVDPSFLTSIRNSVRKELGISEGIWTKISDRLWELAPSGILHAIVLVGFNETNGTVCYNDPAAALFGHPEDGTYAWMNLTKFRKAIWRLSLYNPFSYYIEIFENTSDSPFDKKEAFELAHERNIKKMKGNLSAYDEYVVYEWGCTNLGINALKALKKDLSKGIQCRLTTIFIYKTTCTWYLFPQRYKFCLMLNTAFPSAFNMSECLSVLNYYDQIAIEKYNMSRYLWNNQYLFDDTNISDMCRHDAILLGYEAENWTKLACSFSKFLQRGLFMTLPYALSVIKNMESVLVDIISIEEEILGETV